MVICYALRCSLLKFLIAVSVLQFFILVANSQSFICPNTTTYNQNSTYQVNLARLLSHLSSDNAANNLYLNATVGDNAPDVVYGMSLCRGDLSTDECRACLQTATTEIVQPDKCPEETNVIIWYEQCMLRYSNQSFFGNLDQSVGFILSNGNNVSDPDRFDQVLGDTMNGLIDLARGTGTVGTLKGFAVGEANFTSLSNLYCLVQCTPDLTGLECGQCLSFTLNQRPAGRQGGRILYPSCNIRYEIYPFYNSIAPPAPPPTLTPSSPPPPAQVPDISS